MSGSRWQASASGFIHSLFFGPQDGVYIFLWNVDWLSAEYTAVVPLKMVPFLTTSEGSWNATRASFTYWKPLKMVPFLTTSEGSWNTTRTSFTYWKPLKMVPFLTTSEVTWNTIRTSFTCWKFLALLQCCTCLLPASRHVNRPLLFLIDVN
jgi:hypothetical protein